MDPRGTVDKVWLVHNDTIRIDNLETPADRGLYKDEAASLEKCW
jgi:hypothetical protein